MATRKRQRNLPALTKQNAPGIHPLIKRIVGTMLLAGDIKELTQITITKKAFEWVAEEQGRAVHITNEGKDVVITFTYNGKECKAPF